MVRKNQAMRVGSPDLCHVGISANYLYDDTVRLILGVSTMSHERLSDS